nr:hypothetical protein [Clostridium sp.]
MKESDLEKVAEKASSVVEWTYVPGNPTQEKFIESIKSTDRAGKEQWRI